MDSTHSKKESMKIVSAAFPSSPSNCFGGSHHFAVRFARLGNSFETGKAFHAGGFCRWMICFVALLFIPSSSILIAQVKLPDGFEMVQVASNDLATNIFSMTVSDEGRVFVSGPGYIKQLLDTNDDGIFEEAKIVTGQLRSGAQGMTCDGKHLYAVGDQGLWQLTLDRPEEPPVRLLKIKTGGEHDAHAIRKGPFGWWYLIAGNGIRLRSDFSNTRTSPIKQPRAGILMRISPDFKKREVVAHGFRNAYDFDFSQDGRIFTFDSDGERDISLPWYRPTRVYELLPGDDAGWVTASWKRPDYYLDMPTVLGNAGRGSPTGVTVFDGTGMGMNWDQAVFVADWTFGRILVSQRSELEKVYGPLMPFAVAQGEFGFAVTDLAQSARGDLLVSVGGRGTRGGVYRIFNKRDAIKSGPLGRIPAAGRYFKPEIDQFAPGTWGDDHFMKWDQLLAEERFNLRQASGLIGQNVENINRIPFAPDQQHEWNRFRHRYQVARMGWGKRTSGEIVRLLNASNPLSQLDAIRMLQMNVEALERSLPPVLHGFRSDPDKVQDLLSKQPELLDTLRRVLKQNLKLAKAPMGESERTSAPQNIMPEGLFLRTPHRIAEADLPPAIVRESARLLGMLKARDIRTRNLLASQLTNTSDPIDDIFWLSCLASATNPGSQDSVFTIEQVTASLLKLENKFRNAELPRDRNWNPRVSELARVLFQNKRIAQAFVGHAEFGFPGHAFLAAALPEPIKQFAAQRIFNQLILDERQPDTDQARLLASYASQIPNSFFRTIATRAVEDSSVQRLAIRTLTRQPQPADEDLLLKGLTSSDTNLVSNCASALQRIRIQQVGKASILTWLKWQTWHRNNKVPRQQDRLAIFLRRLNQLELGFELGQPGQDQSKALDAWGNELKSRYPDIFRTLVPERSTPPVVEKLKTAPWSQGRIQQGQTVYQKLQCANCHNGNSRLGPDLTGVSRRFSRDDLFQSIVDPSRQVADRYRATLVETVDGMVYRGSMIYDSVDGITLLDTNGETVRINRDNIESKRLSRESVMPTGLLNQATGQQLADLYAYLKSL